MTVAGRLSERKQKILDLMVKGSSALGLRLSFHDILQQSSLPSEWVQHHSKCCLTNKQTRDDICTPFCVEEVHRALAGLPEGRIHTCPFGYTELAVPVILDGLFAGVLFAGQCWLRKHDRPEPDLIIPPSREWLSDRLVLLQALAARLAVLLRGEDFYVPADRQSEVLQFLQDNMERRPTLQELAEHIKLSVSRTGHVVRDVFNVTFPELVGIVKTREAASLLTGTDLPIGLIAHMVGYDDANYFSYVFRKRLGMSPRSYRRQYCMEA